MRVRLPTTVAAALAALALASAASAQTTDWHIYGGGAPSADEITRGFLFGAGLTNGTVYAGVDGHGLWPTDEGLNQLAAVVPFGVDFKTVATGLNVAVGPTIRNATGRVDFMPVGVVGYTTAELELCIDSFCDSESETQVNFGAGFVAAMKGESGRGLHVGFRWTRNYRAAFTIGFVFQTGG